MNSKKLLALFIAVATVLAAQGVIAGPRYDRLSAGVKNSIQKGEAHLERISKGKGKWAMARIYLLIDATPEEAMAVFTDYEAQRHYIPGMQKSQIVSGKGQRTTVVAYQLDLGLVNSNYKVRDVMGKGGCHQCYLLKWNMVEADKAEAIEGSAYFEPVGNGTLMVYDNWVEPVWGAKLIPGAENKALNSALGAAKAIRNRISGKAKSDRAYVDREVARLRKTL